jgi:hypothetical protein
MLGTILIILAVIGVILVILSVLPGTAGLTPGGWHAGLALIVVAVVLYVVLALVAHGAAYGP